MTQLKRDILGVLALNPGGMTTRDIMEALERKNLAATQRAINGLVFHNQVLSSGPRGGNTYMAATDGNGNTIRRWPKGTTEKIIDGVRVISLPAAPAIGYTPLTRIGGEF